MFRLNALLYSLKLNLLLVERRADYPPIVFSLKYENLAKLLWRAHQRPFPVHSIRFESNDLQIQVRDVMRVSRPWKAALPLCSTWRLRVTWKMAKFHHETRPCVNSLDLASFIEIKRFNLNSLRLSDEIRRFHNKLPVFHLTPKEQNSEKEPLALNGVCRIFRRWNRCECW